jgi:hypothetical protein
MKKERAPAQIVSCPHCSWKGSARGLYTHCRMGHPNKALPDTKGTRVMYTVHPQAEKPVKEKKLTKGGKLSYDERLDRVLRLVEIYVLSQNQGKAVYQLAGIPDLDIDGSGNIRVTKDTLLNEMKKFRDEGRKNHSE